MRTRLLFGLVGAVCCLLAALLADLVFAKSGLARSLDDSGTQVLIYRGEIARRLDRAGARTGDIQISLAWNNRNDLDIYCLDPNKYLINFKHPVSLSGGSLDVDANGSVDDLTNTPVENIYWPAGRALSGQYRVWVNYYNNHGAHDPTPFTVRVIQNGQIRHFSGQVSPEKRDQFVEQFTFRGDRFHRNQWLPLLMPVLITGLWGGLMALALAGGLVVAQQWLTRRHYGKAMLPARGIPAIAAWGTAAGLVGGLAGQIFYSVACLVDTGLATEWLRVPGWALLGALTGWGMALRMPNLARRAGLYAGLAGGLLGALSFATGLGTGSDLMGRVAAAGGIGLLIGLMIQLVLEPLAESETVDASHYILQPSRLRAYKTRAAGTLRLPDSPPPSKRR